MEDPRVRASTIATTTFKFLPNIELCLVARHMHLGTSLADYLPDTTAHNTSLIQTYVKFQIDTIGS